MSPEITTNGSSTGQDPERANAQGRSRSSEDKYKVKLYVVGVVSVVIAIMTFLIGVLARVWTDEIECYQSYVATDCDNYYWYSAEALWSSPFLAISGGCAIHVKRFPTAGSFRRSMFMSAFSTAVMVALIVLSIKAFWFFENQKLLVLVFTRGILAVFGLAGAMTSAIQFIIGFIRRENNIRNSRNEATTYNEMRTVEQTAVANTPAVDIAQPSGDSPPCYSYCVEGNPGEISMR